MDTLILDMYAFKIGNIYIFIVRTFTPDSSNTTNDDVHYSPISMALLYVNESVFGQTKTMGF